MAAPASTTSLSCAATASSPSSAGSAALSAARQAPSENSLYAITVLGSNAASAARQGARSGKRRTPDSVRGSSMDVSVGYALAVAKRAQLRSQLLPPHPGGAAGERVHPPPPARNVEQLEMAHPGRHRGIDDQMVAVRCQAEHGAQQ